MTSAPRRQRNRLGGGGRGGQLPVHPPLASSSSSTLPIASSVFLFRHWAHHRQHSTCSRVGSSIHRKPQVRLQLRYTRLRFLRIFLNIFLESSSIIWPSFFST